MAEAAIVSLLLPPLFEKLASGTLQQVGKMLGVPRELEKLQSTLSTVEAVLQDAEEKEMTNAALRNWLEKLKKAAYDADDVLDEAHYELLWRDADIHRGIKNKVNDFFSSHNPLLFRAKMARKVKDIVSKLDEIAVERSKFHLRSDAAAVGRPLEWRQTHSHVIDSEVIGRAEDKRKIVEMLVSDASSSSGGRGSPRVLPIIGMGGLGKTTLAQMVFNELKVKAQFERCMWVCVSEDFSIPRLAKEIIKSAGGSASGDASMDQLLQELKDTLGLKRYLLILDDVWNEDPHTWGELRVLLTFGADGSVVIVTTRSEKVAAIVGTADPYRLEHLSEDECWQLFEQKAFPGGAGKRPELAKIGRKITERCRGLPLAAKVMGSMMHLKTEERQWQNVLDSEVWNIQNGKDWIIRVLKLSYHQLPVHLKRCFAFCAIFPKDHKIEKDLLIQLWMANGFIPTGGGLELEEKGEHIFNELASKSFFQDIQTSYWEQNAITSCKIHDLIHDVALSIMDKECIILDPEQLEGKSGGDIRHLLITYETTPSILDNIYKSRSTLRTLLSVRHYSVGFTNIISKLKAPCVLDLRCFNFQKCPISRDNMKHIRYLDLSDTACTMLPEAISQLFHLHTLKIENCKKLRELPKGMRYMCNLRHVYNGGCDSLTHMPIGLHKLSLQTLRMFTASKKAGSGSIADLEDLDLGDALQLCKLENVIDEAEAAKANLVSKEKIKSLMLKWGEPAEITSAPSPDNAEKILESLQPHQHIENLSIYGYKGRQSPSWMVGCRWLKRLDIRNCFRLEDNIPCLPSLTELIVEKCPFLCGVKGLFRSMTCLEELKISGSDKLVSLLEEEEDDEDSSSSSDSRWGGRLRYLDISNCKAPLFSSSSLGMWKNLHSLEYLTFSNCSSLTDFPDELTRGLTSLKSLYIQDCNIRSFAGTGGGGGGRRKGEEGGGGRYFGLQYLTSLEYLTIQKCEALASVSLEGLQGLTWLKISGCTKLKSLPDGLRGLTNLRTLSIRDFPALTTLPDLLGGLTNLRNLTIGDFPALTTLPDWLGGLTALTSLWICDLTSLTTLPDGLGGLTQLTDLMIDGCLSLTVLSDGLGGLTGLRQLYIQRCTALTALPDWMGGLTGLTFLRIQGCTALTALPDGLEGLARLGSLEITGCPLLATLPMGLQQRLPHLKQLSIQECPRLERRFRTGGDYFHWISGIPRVTIS